MNRGLLGESVTNELEEHWPDLLRFARSLARDADLADEIAQESMVRALQRDSGLPVVENPRGWLFQIAVNVFREWWRKRIRDRTHAAKFAEQQSSHSVEIPDGVAENREYLAEIWRFVQELPTIQREVLVLSFVEGFSHSQIAQRLETTTVNVKANLCVARSKLRKRFLNSK